MDGNTTAARAIGSSGAETADFLIGVTDLEIFYRTHTGAPVPQHPTLSIRIPAAATSRDEKIAAVEAVAEALGVHATWQEGVLYARREFGPVLLECHYSPAQVIDRAQPAGVPAEVAA
jgi:hypothetical protein